MNIAIQLLRYLDQKRKIAKNKEQRRSSEESEGQMDPNNTLKPVRDPGKKTKNKLEPLDTKIKRQKPVSTSVPLI